ncbi:MAG: glycosyltransferase family 2 protein [Planctomycetota bacterium]
MSPRVSIGMPVYNGEQFIRKAIETLLAQEFADFELIICDNASDDATREICLEYKRKDSRIRYYRNKENIGAAENFNLAFKLLTGEFFKWAGHDDSWAPDYLKLCVEALERNPSAILCFCPSVYFNDDGRFICCYDQDHRVYSTKPHKRFTQMLWSTSRIDPVYAVVRTEALKRTGLMRNILGTDAILAVELSLIGPFHFIPKPMVFRRSHQMRDCDERLQRIDPRGRFTHLAFSRRCIEYVRLTKRSPLTYAQRFYLILNIICFYLNFQVRRHLKAFWQRLVILKSPDRIAASRFAYKSLRVKAFSRFARRASWPELSRFLADLSASAPIPLWCRAAKLLAHRPEKEAQQVLAEWLQDKTECRRLAAALAMAEEPARWAYLLRSRLDIEESTRVRNLLKITIANCYQSTSCRPREKQQNQKSIKNEINIID